jgi:nitrate reductase alpha subunit
VPAAQCTRIAREFADNADRSGGRSMILMGAGTNHWFHSDTTYRAMLALTTLTGCQGVNGGGWAHYVGQEKCRPVTGWSQLAFGLDWSRPPRQMIGTAYWYLHTDQWRYDGYDAGRWPPAGHRRVAGAHTADLLARRPGSAGCRPCPFDRNPLDWPTRLAADPDDPAGGSAALREGRLGFAGQDRTPANWRVLTVWRANLLGSSARATSTSCATCWAPIPRAATDAARAPPAQGAGTSRHPRASSTCCSRSISG